jgi:hypothetical protein
MNITGGFDLQRERDILTLRASNRARWFGALFGGFALFWMWGWIQQGTGGDISYWLGLALGSSFAVIGFILLLRHEITTIFELRSRRVLINVQLCNGWYERRQTYAFDEVASLGVKEYAGEGYSYMPVLVLRSGKTRWLATMNGGYLAFAKAIEEIAHATGLSKMDAPVNGR